MESVEIQKLIEEKLNKIIEVKNLMEEEKEKEAKMVNEEKEKEEKEKEKEMEIMEEKKEDEEEKKEEKEIMYEDKYVEIEEDPIEESFNMGYELIKKSKVEVIPASKGSKSFHSLVEMVPLQLCYSC